MTTSIKAPSFTQVLNAMSSTEGMTVNQIAEAIGKSESRVRELLKAAGDAVIAANTKPALFILTAKFVEAEKIEAPAPVGNVFAGLTDTPAETALLQDMIAAQPKAARKGPLNPQPAIDKKAAILEAAGYTLSYAARLWTITGDNFAFTMNSKEFAGYKGDEILSILPKA